MVGLSFADDEEAMEFRDKVLRRESIRKPNFEPIREPSSLPAMKQPELRSSTASNTSLDKPGSRSKESGWGFGRKATKDKKGKIDKSMISAPSEFK